MRSNAVLELLFLAALWGGSFLLLRLTAPAFGPFFLIEIRVFMGFAVLLPILLFASRLKELLANWRIIALLSLTNMCLPFCLLAYASLSLGAGMVSVLNATVPFFAAVTGFLLFRERLTAAGMLGLVMGFIGVLVLMGGDVESVGGAEGLLAFLAGLVAAVCYGFSANLINRRLLGVSGLAITTGCLFFTTVYLLPALVWLRPAELPAASQWLAVLLLGTVCTGLPYVLFYRLVLRFGAYQTLTVTYLVPVFSISYGVLLLAEQFTLSMLAGSLLVLLGVAVTTGRLRLTPRISP